MTYRHLQRLSALIALAMALLVPARAWAALLPACENREVATQQPRVDDAERDVASLCNEGNAEDEVGDSKVPALCDPRGASIIAPPRIHPIIDARIESGVRCGVTITTPMLSTGTDDGTSAIAQVAMPGHAVVADEEMVPAPSYELAPDFTPPDGRALAGVARSVYHPPR